MSGGPMKYYMSPIDHEVAGLELRPGIDTVTADTAIRLWELLDKIEDVQNILKPDPDDIEAWKRLVARIIEISEKRHKYLVSDGHKLHIPVIDDEIGMPMVDGNEEV